MSAAVDVSRPSDHFDFSQPIGETDGPHAVSTFRPALGAVTAALVDALILQQLLYLTSKRSTPWIQASAGYLARPLGIARTTVADALGRLREAGYIEARQPEPGRACQYRVDLESLIAGLEEAGYSGATADQLLGCPPEDEGGDESRHPPCRDSSGGGCRDSAHKEQSKNKKEYKDLEADGRAHEAVDELDEQTTPAPNNPTDQHIWETFKTWGISKSEAERIRQTLEALGLSEEMIRQYVSERAADFASRSRQIARSEVIRYTTARQDLADRGYIRPLVAVSESSADSRPDEAETPADELDETRKDSPATDIHSSAVQQLADDLMDQDPGMTRREAETKALYQMLEE